MNSLAVSQTIIPNQDFLERMKGYLTEDAIQFLTQRNSDGSYFIEWLDLNGLKSAAGIVAGKKWTAEQLKVMVGYDNGIDGLCESGIELECTMMSIMKKPPLKFKPVAAVSTAILNDKCYFFDAVKQYGGDVCKLMANPKQRRRLLVRGNLALLLVLKEGRVIRWANPVSGTPSAFTPQGMDQKMHVSLIRSFYAKLAEKRRSWKAEDGPFPVYFQTGSSISIPYHIEIGTKKLSEIANREVGIAVSELIEHMAKF